MLKSHSLSEPFIGGFKRLDNVINILPFREGLVRPLLFLPFCIDISQLFINFVGE